MLFRYLIFGRFERKVKNKYLIPIQWRLVGKIPSFRRNILLQFQPWIWGQNVYPKCQYLLTSERGPITSIDNFNSMKFKSNKYILYLYPLMSQPTCFNSKAASRISMIFGLGNNLYPKVCWENLILVCTHGIIFASTKGRTLIIALDGQFNIVGDLHTTAKGDLMPPCQVSGNEYVRRALE